MDEEEKDAIIGQTRTFSVLEILTNLLDDKITNTANEEPRVRPSEYMNQMLLTTDERIDFLLKSRRKQTRQTLSDRSHDSAFEVSPRVVIFQRFAPGEVYNVTLTVRNIAKVSRYLKTSCELDPCFSVEFRGTCYSPMLAPGLSQSHNVKFIPEERRDYEYRLTFITDVGEFAVPVIAIGPRAILDFPDRLDIPSTPVKISSSKVILVRNVGDAPAVFTLYSDNPRFSIEPSKGRIEEEQTLQFTVNFWSDKCGDFQGNLFLEYDSGEKLRMDLRCSTTNCAIRVDRGSIRLEETYLGLSRSKTLAIHNRSDYIVKFQWMRHKDRDTDEQQREKYKKLYQGMYDMELLRCADLVHYDICLPDTHQQICQRIYTDETTSLMKANFHYNHSSFELTPQEGEIWPQSSADVTVFFTATGVGEVTSTAYLEVTGREDRIPISLLGVGKGPVFRLNVVTIDLQNIYLCSVHNYEVVADNKGQICGTLSYQPRASDFGGTIEMTPSCLTLKPNEHKSFNLSFSSNRKGDFVERVDLVVKESNEVLSLHIKGCIVCPTLHFNKESLDFGATALGFSTRQEVCLHNLSLMPVTFSITVLNDGDQPALIHEEFAKAQTKPSFPSNPQEFLVSPEEGVVPAHSFLKIKIIYTANIERSGNTTLQVDMWDSDSDPVKLPIRFCGKVATLAIKPAEISIRFCFINFPYSRSFTVENNSDLDGYFYLIPQPLSDNSPIVYSTSMHQGFIKARQSKTINGTIITRVLGKQSTTLSMLTMGEKSPLVSCVITVNGQGPVISTQPTSLDFGEVQVLQERVMKFSVISDAPIPAHFNVSLSKKKSPWTVQPDSGDLEPNGSMEIEVKLYLRDSGKYSDNIVLLVVSSRSIPVYLTAIGVGCAIVFEPSIFPTFDMGRIFSQQRTNQPIVLKNMGTRHHQIAWSNEPELRLHRGQPAISENSKFQVQPLILDIPAGGSSTVQCILADDASESVQEDWYVFGQVQGQGKRELIGTSTFKVTLTQPQIVFSKKELTFRVDMWTQADKLQQTDELFVTNRSKLDLNVQLSVNPPFDLVTDTKEHVQTMRIVLVDRATTKICAHFSATADPGNLYSQSYNGVLWLEYDEHPNKDKIKCRGSVNFPNLTLSPKDFTLNCELGSSAEEILTLTNSGPVSATYKFLWKAGSIEIERSARKNHTSPSEPTWDTTVPVHDISIPSTADEETCTRCQDGSGDGPTKPIVPPTNSPVSEEYLQKHKPEMEATEENLETTESAITPEEVKDFLLPIVEKFFVEDRELSALENIDYGPPPPDCLNEALTVVPSEGTVLPYSTQYVHVGFHGFEPLQIKVTAACKIVHGPTEEINIFARADTVQFSVDAVDIDFGQQLFYESGRRSFTVKNHSAIDFAFKINGCYPTSDGSIDRFDVNPLKIEPDGGIVEAQSSVKLDVEHRPTTLGAINHQFKLQIGHLMPLIINVKAVGTFPQVYPCIPRVDLHDKYPAELGYTAIQSLTTEFIANKVKTVSRGCSPIDRRIYLPEEYEDVHEDANLTATDEWSIIPPDDVFPSIVDIDMAIERLLASRFVEQHSYTLMQYTLTNKKQPILHLFSPQYIIDMGYVIIGLTAHYSTTIINYGPWTVELRMRKLRKKDELEKSGIVVQFQNHTHLGVGNSAPLHVTWHPTRERYTEKETRVEHTIYLEVVHGCTIPIIIKGTVTYPHVTVSTNLLDFQNVIVGECLMMCILIKNGGSVECQWDAKLSTIRKKHAENPFHVHYNCNICLPGQSEVLRVYLKPRKSCHMEAKLNVIVKMGLESHTITLTGRRMERRLNIIEPAVSFLPVVPFTEIQEAVFTIENPCEYPVEFFWRHLDSSFAIEDRVARTLMHYYKAEEILLPPRQPGESMPPLLTEFYNNLVREMAVALAAERDEEDEGPVLSSEEQREPKEGQEKRSSEANGKRKGSTVRKKSLRSSRRKSVGQKSNARRGSGHREKANEFSDDSSSSGSPSKKERTFAIDFGDVALPTNDPEEIQQLLYRYIDGLHKTADFCEKMRDPVKELFKNFETKSAPPDNLADPSKPERKACIFFHGAPFTDYQETACRSAKALGVPVLCIDKAIIETIAFGESSSAVRLRQIVDDTYQDYVATFEKQRNVSVVDTTRKNEEADQNEMKSETNEDKNQAKEIKFPETGGRKSSKKESSPKILKEDSRPKSADNGAFDMRREAILQLRAEDDPLREFDKIPVAENLETLDALSKYEYKVQTISLLQKVLSGGTTVGTTRDKISAKAADKTARRKQESAFGGVDFELVSEALQERLSMEDFKRGFVLQSLKSTFFRDDVVETLLRLLRIIGHVEYSLFVTFLNSMAEYDRKVEKLRELSEKSTTDHAKRIQDIDEMSLSEYDSLPDEEKRMYLEAILPTKKEEALQRRTQFSQRAAESRKKKEVRGRTQSLKTAKAKRASKSAKSKATEANYPDKKSSVSRPASSKKEAASKVTKSRDSSKHRKENVSEEMKQIIAAMDQYSSELSAIENIIRNWDPVKKVVEQPSTGKTKVPKTAKSRDTAVPDTSRGVRANKFYVWYVKASDPWHETLYNTIVLQMKENSMAKSVLLNESKPELDLRPKLYSVLTSKGTEQPPQQIHGDVYQLVSISPIPDSVLPIGESVRNSNTSLQEISSEMKETRKKRRRKSSAIRVEDQKSLNTSTIESKGTNNASTLETTVEEPLKPRWILQPNEIQRFKIYFRPEETGIFEKTYTLSIVNGNTYEINVKGVADIPGLNMNPEAVFPKVENTKLNDANEPTYFLDIAAFDFGSILILRKDKRAHHREAEFKFRNVSKVDAEVYFSLAANCPGCFSIEPEKLLIAPGENGSLKLSAVATKLGPLYDRLSLCVTGNPEVETIELRSNGAKLDVELSENQLHFGRTLLYRRELRVLTIRNKSAVPIFWQVDVEEPAEPQITFTPTKGAVKAKTEDKIEFCYHGTRIGIVEGETMIFKVFLYEDDADPILTDTITLSGETYDVAVDIDHANPIDLKCVRVDYPASAFFTIKNRGSYEVKYVITLEDDDKLAKIRTRSTVNLKEALEIRPTSGTVQPRREASVQVVFIPKTELTLKESPILKCHLVDTNKEATVVAELPLTVSLTAYYTRYRVYPYPVVDFGSLGICTEKTMYLNIENIGKFPLHYSIYVQQDRHPSLAYMSQVRKENMIRKANPGERGADAATKREKKSTKAEKVTTKASAELGSLTVGPMTVTKTEGDVNVGGTDSIAINCYPEFVGSQEEQITILVADSVPEDRNGKTVTLSVHSCVPSVDFQNLEAIFQENRLADRIQDFDCPREIGAHAVFALQEKCLYFRYVSVLRTHVTCFKLHNRNVVPADVEVEFSKESLTPKGAKPDTFIVEPRRERIPPMSYKTFTVSFTPAVIETFKGQIEAIVDLPAHLNDEKFVFKLVGESCVPEVAIVEPAPGKRERAVANFGRTLVAETSAKKFTIENVGFVEAKVIVEISDDPDFLFALSACPDTRNFLQTWDDDYYESNDRCTVIRLTSGSVAHFEVTFRPKDVGKYEGKIRLFIVDNPYENLMIDLEGTAYIEAVVFEGLELVDNKRKIANGSRDSNYKARKSVSKRNSLASASTATTITVSLNYNLDYGACFVNKMYKRIFRIANKSVDQWFRFEWGAHIDVVFVPSIGHLKYQTCKEITATFLASEPTNHANTRIECVLCEIEIADPSCDMAWDDRQTEVRWEEIDSDIGNHGTDAEILARKLVEPTTEPSHDVVPGTTKCIQVLLDATVAFSEYSCAVQEIHFKDTLMFQTRKFSFTLTNPGIVSTVFSWKISMDEHYPKRFLDSPTTTSRPRSAEDVRSRPNTRSSKSIFSTRNQLYRAMEEKEEGSDGDSQNLKSHRFGPLPLHDTTIEVRPASSSYRHSDLFSSTAGLTERSTDSWLEGDDLPFEIDPAEESLSPGQSAECTLKFSPMDVFYYKAYLTCRVENLNPKATELVIPIAARSLLPYCHFDVQESDYITSGRRDPKLPGPVGYEMEDSTLWENIRVIEFKAVGVGETHVKKFRLVNPTADDYHFSWRDRTLNAGDAISNFHCAVPEGIAKRGKRTDLAFTFLAEEVGIFESFWLFSIDRYNLESLFLFVGVVTEPSVHCLTVHLRLKPTVLGVTVRDSMRIHNNEDCPIPFQILEGSLYSEGKFQRLTITPLTGILTPKSDQTFLVEYHPTRVGEFHFSVQCAVKFIKKPLTIFISSSAYDIVSSVSYTDPKGQIVQIDEAKENVIDFGKLMPNESSVVKLEIINSGRTAFYYGWDLGITPEIVSRGMYNVKMSQQQGHVTGDSRATCYLSFRAFQKVTVKNHCVTLTISKGPTYRFALKAFAKKPAVEFSFSQYDFGPCYIHEINALSYYTELSLTNFENSAFIIECKFEEQPHMSVDLEPISQALAPQSTVDISIAFRPLKETKYCERLLFTINSTIEKKIIITGEGITYKVRLANPRDKSIDLGSSPVNKTITRKVPVINEGRAPIELRFDLMKNLSLYGDHRETQKSCAAAPEAIASELEHASILETKRSWTHDATLQTEEQKISEVLKIEPSTDVLLQPGKRVNVIVKFAPTCRMRPFACKVALQTASTILPLFVVRGCCVAPEFRLNRTYLPFGTVVEGCAKEGTILLLNTGDVGARFKWNASKLPEDFSIAPKSGYCSPGMDVNFVVKFQPSRQRNLIEGEVSIEVEKYGSLSAKITGGCCKLPEPIATLFFVSTVREKETKSVTIANSTNLPWKLEAEVTGDYFFVEDVLHVPAQTSVSCAITYSPLAMNSKDSPHKGALLIKFPDETTPVLYSLHGLSLEPRVLAKVHRRFPAKTKYTELFPVQNWSDNQRRFECKIELLQGSETQSKKIPLFNFAGTGRIDVPANSQRDYRAIFYSYEEFNFHFKVMFIDEQGEYQFYEVEYEVANPEVIESIKLSTAVRSLACYSLRLENPLQDLSITYTAQCQHPSVTIREMPKIVTPLRHEYVNVEYYPMLPSDETAIILDIHCKELGHFPYELRLKATQAPPEKLTRVNAVLGSDTAFSLTVNNRTKKSVEFAVKVDSDCFTCKKSVEVPGLKEGTIDVIYEPSDIKNISATLTASSSIGGEYVFPVIGTYSLPKPLGPYTITRSAPTSIPFRNVFKETKTFDFLLDLPEVFATETPSVTLKQKQNFNVKVRLRNDNKSEEELNDDTYPMTGKLVVCCTDPRLSHVNWIYYLRGVFDESQNE